MTELNCTMNEVGCIEGMQGAIDEYEDNSIRPKKPLISNGAKEILEICLQITLLMTTSLFGVGSNAVNILVYRKQGLTDSITLGLLALSISDLLVVLLSLVTASCYAAKAILPDSSIDFMAVQYVSGGTFRNIAYSISSLFTAFLSVERCCCVVLPFKVKFIFTRSRTCVVLASILLFHVACYAPFVANQGLRWKPVVTGDGNVTFRLKLHFTASRPAVAKFVYLLRGIIVPTVCQVVVTVCAVILTNGLKASSTFRQAMKTTTTSNANGDSTAKEDTSNAMKESNAKRDRKANKDNNAKGDSNANGGSDANRNSWDTTKDVGEVGHGEGHVRMAQRDARLIKAMVLLVAIFSFCNVPLLAVTYAQFFVAGLSIGGPYHNLLSTCYSVVYALTSLNASVNIFVYYHTSSKFKEVYTSLFSASR